VPVTSKPRLASPVAALSASPEMPEPFSTLTLTLDGLAVSTCAPPVGRGELRVVFGAVVFGTVTSCAMAENT
jgi:hypothetical protein